MGTQHFIKSWFIYSELYLELNFFNVLEDLAIKNKLYAMVRYTPPTK